jgi:membrane associated rhomboid family serine protease
MIPLKDNLSCKVFPWVTLILIALNCVGFAIELSLPDGAVGNFMMHWCVVPSNIMHAFASGSIAAMGMALLTVVTAMFLHGGWMHLIGNMVFLQAFGRAVEARLGSVRFFLLYILGGFAAWGMHMFSDPTSTVPALGASGAIAFVLGAYLVFYPKAEMKTVFLLGVLPLLVVVRAWLLLVVWFGLQLIDGIGPILNPTADAGGVAYWAHIGGFLFGTLAAGIWSLARPVSSVCYTPMTACACDCKGPCHKKHWFGFLSLRRNNASGNEGHSCKHDHEQK